ncbi:MAG TPA: alpha/beta fold hydrolase [Leptolyngbyaceae cyanobacterium]
MGLTLLIKLIQISGVAIAIAYAICCLFLYLLQNRLIFFPSPVIQVTPEVFNLTYQEVWLPVSTPSGKIERIHGWWIPGKGKQTILYLHGNGINIGANVAHANRFHQLGFSVLLLDYRGYGRSEGSFPKEAEVYQDAETAWQYLIQEKKISPDQIIIYGHSLGGAIAINLAVKHPEAAGLIVESSFTSLRKMVDRMGNYWMFPVDLILHHRFDSINKVKKLEMPVLFIHGIGDSLIPYQMSEQLFAAAPEPKQILLVPEAGHNNVAEIAGQKYLQTVQKFFQLKPTTTNY